MISVCLCTYNGEKKIKRQLDSILNQTLPPDEIVVYDDASTDKTVEIIKEYIQSNPKIRWNLNIRTKNAGWRKNFHDAINLCEGDFIFTCDQDDYWYPYKIEKMTGVMKQYPSILLLSSNYYLEQNGILSKRKKQRYNEKIRFVSYSSQKNFVPFNPGCTYCFRKELISDFNSIWSEGMAHDRVLWVAAATNNGLYLYNKPCIKWVRTGVTASAINNSHFSRERFEFKKIANSADEAIAKSLIVFAKEKKDRKSESYYAKYLKKILLQKSFYGKPTVGKAFKLLVKLHWYPTFKSYLQDMIAFMYYKN